MIIWILGWLASFCFVLWWHINIDDEKFVTYGTVLSMLAVNAIIWPIILILYVPDLFKVIFNADIFDRPFYKNGLFFPKEK